MGLCRLLEVTKHDRYIALFSISGTFSAFKITVDDGISMTVLVHLELPSNHGSEAQIFPSNTWLNLVLGPVSLSRSNGTCVTRAIRNQKGLLIGPASDCFGI